MNSKHRLSGFTLTALFSLAVLTACGGGGGGGGGGSGGGSPTPPATPAATAVGVPTGAPVSATIGTSGGRLVSADGQFELIVPPGALTSDTTLSMTPITNEAPLGIRNGLRLEPAGTQFSGPVQLVFHYGAKLAGTTPDMLLVATQDAAGFWQSQAAPVVDIVANTATAQLTHFSDWSFASCGQLTIDNYVLGPMDEAHLSVNEQCESPQQQSGPLGGVRTATGPVEWKLEDSQGQPGPGTLTPSGATATLAGSSTPPPDPRAVVSATVTRGGVRRVYEDTIAVASVVTFSIDGQDVIVSGSPFVMTLAGKSSVNAANSSGSVSVGFFGIGVGGFASDPQADAPVSATTSANYVDSYIVPCTNMIRYTTTNISVSHANKQRQFIVGSFSGVLATSRGQITCGGSNPPDWVEVPLTGAFITRWLSYD